MNFQDLLLKAHEIEVRKLQESKKLDRALKSIYESRATKVHDVTSSTLRFIKIV